MNANRASRYCRCGTRLARDHAGSRCHPCQRKLAAVRAEPPHVPPGFWDTPQFRDASIAQHIGHLSRAYRKHPAHASVYGGDGIPQDVLAGWLGITQAQVSRIENGPPVRHLDQLAHWARTLHIPDHLLWFTLPEHQATRSPRESGRHVPEADDRIVPAIVGQGRQRFPEIDDMHRRELLRVLSMAGAVLAAPSVDGHLDWERMGYSSRTGRLDSATVDEYEKLNTHLWRVFALSKSKDLTFPVVQDQLDVLVNRLQQGQPAATQRRLCSLTADLFQLAGEIFFDCDQYTEAAHCYTLAATAGQEAEAFDLWACALTRHAFIGVYDRRFASSLPMVELAARLARRGDGTLSTKYWVSAVRAQVLAGLGELDACHQALDTAEHVHELSAPVHNGGWLRFDGFRLSEERGTCYVELQRPDLADAALTDALAQSLSLRRRGSALTDLALVGAQRRDLDHLLVHAHAALDTARQTGSGVIGRRLRRLQAHLTPFLADSRVRDLDMQFATLAGTPAVR